MDSRVGVMERVRTQYGAGRAGQFLRHYQRQFRDRRNGVPDRAPEQVIAEPTRPRIQRQLAL
jgi:hypothetical protein